MAGGRKEDGRFDAERLRVQLKLLRCRLENLCKQLKNTHGGRRREIATLLSQGQEERARVNVKYLIRDDYMLEAYEMLLSSTEDVLQSVGLLAREAALDADMGPPVRALLYACGRVESPELDRVRQQLTALLGAEACDVSGDAGRQLVDPRLVVKLSIRTPEGGLADRYMAAIAESYGVSWTPPVREAPAAETTAVPACVPAACDAPVLSSRPPPYPGTIAVDAPTPAPAATSAVNSPASTSAASSSRSPTFEELTERFLALKKR